MSRPRWLKGLVLTSSCLLAGGYLVYTGCQSAQKPVAVMAPQQQAAKTADPLTLNAQPPAAEPQTPKRFTRQIFWGSKSGPITPIPDDPGDPMTLRQPIKITPSPDVAAIVRPPAPPPSPTFETVGRAGPIRIVQPGFPRRMMPSSKLATVDLVPPPEHPLEITPRIDDSPKPTVIDWPSPYIAELMNTAPPKPMALSPLPPTTRPARSGPPEWLTNRDMNQLFFWARVSDPLRLEQPMHLSPQWPVGARLSPPLVDQLRGQIQARIWTNGLLTYPKPPIEPFSLTPTAEYAPFLEPVPVGH